MSEYTLKSKQNPSKANYFAICILCLFGFVSAIIFIFLKNDISNIFIDGIMNLVDEINNSFSNFFDNKNETNLFNLIKICLYALWKAFLLYSIFIPIPKRNINFQSFDDVRIHTYKYAFDFMVFRIGFILIAFSVNIYSWDIYFYNNSPLTSAIIFFSVGLVMIILMYDKDINTKK